MPRYTHKITRTIEPETFYTKLEQASFFRRRYKAFVLLLYLTGCRVSEILALTPEDFRFTDKFIFVTVHRLKGSTQRHNTLPLPLDERTKEVKTIVLIMPFERRIFDFSRRTAHRICKRHFGAYPHFFRMNRATQIIRKFGVSYAKTWLGITLKAMDHYVAEERLTEIGASLQ